MADIKRIPKTRIRKPLNKPAQQSNEPHTTRVVLDLDDDTIENVDKFNKGGDVTREEFIKGLIASQLAELLIDELEG
jgi:hypothetical protein